MAGFIPNEIIDRIVEESDIVEIIDKRRTAAVAWPGYAEDHGTGVIRMDSMTRRNAGVSIGDKVIVRKAKVKPATLVKLAPASMTLTVDENFVAYIKRRLLDHPLCDGDIVQVPVLGQAIPFVVISTRNPIASSLSRSITCR